MTQIIDPQQAALINRGMRLMQTVNSEGWPDVVKISEAIVDLALAEVENDPGLDEKKTAQLTFIWKTVKTHHKQLFGSIIEMIAMGNQAQQSLVPKKPIEPELSGTSVRPRCDVEEEMNNAGSENKSESQP